MTRQELIRIKAIELENKRRILKACPNVPDRSGIYFLTRAEDGFRFDYIVQAKRLLTRLAGHLKGYQHIEHSLRKRGLYSESNPTGWKVAYIECQEQYLDEQEQKHIVAYANAGYQLLNKTSGSQGKGKKDIADEPTKGYLEGLHNGYKKAQKEMAHLFKLHLKCETKKEPPTKLQVKALEKFNNFIEVGVEE